MDGWSKRGNERDIERKERERDREREREKPVVE